MIDHFPKSLDFRESEIIKDIRWRTVWVLICMSSDESIMGAKQNWATRVMVWGSMQPHKCHAPMVWTCAQFTTSGSLLSGFLQCRDATEYQRRSRMFPQAIEEQVSKAKTCYCPVCNCVCKLQLIPIWSQAVSCSLHILLMGVQKHAMLKFTTCSKQKQLTLRHTQACDYLILVR